MLEILMNPSVFEVTLVYRGSVIGAEITYKKKGNLLRVLKISEDYDTLIEMLKKEVSNAS